MGNPDKKESFFDRLKKKRRLIFVDEKTYEQRWATQLSFFNIITLVGLFAIFIMFITYILIAFTPLSPFLYDDENDDYRETAIANRQKADSLEKVVQSHKKYIHRIRTIILGKDFKEDTIYQSSDNLNASVDSLRLDPDKEDSTFRKIMEKEKMPRSFHNTSNQSFKGIFFYTPIIGNISQSFAPEKGHYGTDVISKKDTPIKAALDGKVVYSGFSLKDGKFVILAHEGDILTIYKHNSDVLVSTGTTVKAGDPVAIIGNTGENTDGYHVHFEIWYNGVPVNPENYISFE